MRKAAAVHKYYAVFHVVSLMIMRSPLHAAHHMPSSTSSVELISMTRLAHQTLAGGIPDTLRPRQQAGKVEVIIRHKIVREVKAV